MASNPTLQPPHIKVDVPVYGDICSILIPVVSNKSTTKWRAIWSSDKALCGRYQAAQFDLCELQMDLAGLYNSSFADCATTKWIAPSTIEIPAALAIDYYPRLDTLRTAAPDINLEHLWWLIPLPIFFAVFIVGSVLAASVCCVKCRKKKREAGGREEGASEWPRPLYEVKTDMEMEVTEKGDSVTPQFFGSDGRSPNVQQ